MDKPDDAKPHNKNSAQDEQRYAGPNRSSFQPNFVKTAENDVLDLGWGEGVLSDGRPFRIECWCQDQVTMLTYFLSTEGLQGATNESLGRFLVKEGLLEFRGSEKYVAASKIFDDSGNEMWAINVVVGDEDKTYIKDHHQLHKWNRSPRV
jgi:hypothetical protein